ncbi:MAG: hypothetical protein K2J46_09030, partial [Muribaculaceae bacterium]|nr:hypothetical protein [Muribaculaceae bacterium]
MKSKSFLFIGSWIKPLEPLPLEQRWNVLEAIVEYATTGCLTKTLSPVETIAFGFIRNEIDRMASHRNELRDKRRAAANSRWEKDQTSQPSNDTIVNVVASNACEASECKCMHTDAPYDIVSESVSESVSEKQSKTMRTHAKRESAVQSQYDDAQLLNRFFDDKNYRKIEALAMKHHVEIPVLKTMAEEITMQWALTEKTHSNYQDAASHLIFALADRIARERKARLQTIAEGGVPDSAPKGILGIGEYIDEKGHRTYNGIDIIPNDAPPRP